MKKNNQHFAKIRYSACMLGVVMTFSGCSTTSTEPKLSYDLNAAKQLFNDRQLGETAVENKNGIQQSELQRKDVRRKLVQFRYAPLSFENQDFRDYLKRMSIDAAYQTDSMGKQKQESMTGVERSLFQKERLNKRRLLVIREMNKMQSQLNAFGIPLILSKKQVQAQLTFRETPLTVVLQKLSNQTGVQIQLTEKLRSTRKKISGHYQGDMLSVLHQMQKANLVEVRIGATENDILIISPNEANESKYEMQGYVDPFSQAISDEDGQLILMQYNELVASLSGGDPDRFIRRLADMRPPSIGGGITQAYEKIDKFGTNLKRLLSAFDKETSDIQEGFIKISSIGEGEISETIRSKGVIDRAVCPGEELVTEKIFIYKESPKEIVKFLDNYFNTSGVKKNLVTELTATSQKAPSVIGSDANPGLSSGNANAPAKAPSEISVSVAEKKQAIVKQVKENRELLDAERCAFINSDIKFKVLEDPSGVIVTGSVQQIELAVRLTEDIDIPTQQVLAEVFLVEVQKNWAKTIESRVARNSGKVLYGSGTISQVMDFSSNIKSTGGLQGQVISQAGDINAFINLIESNSVGRSISSPTLIAKNNEEAEISKVVTLRYKLTTAIQNPLTSPIGAVPNQQIQKLDVPLKLKIKPAINQHNKHVTLNFEYEETTLNPEPADSPIEKGTTKNSIITTLETAPGDVVVLAGLFKEGNSKALSGLPGTTALNPLNLFLGGADNMSTQSTELLVFIKPTVIEPKSQFSQSTSAKRQ